MTSISAAQSSPTDLATLQQTVNGKINDRLTKLSALDQSLQSNTTLSAAARQQLEGEITSDETGLQALATKVGSETTTSAVQADAKSMVVDYRVFAVEAPKVRLAERVADQEQRVTNLQDRVNTKVQAGTDSAPDLGDAQTELNSAQSALQGQSDSLLALTPQSYAANLFDQYHSATAAAKAYLDAAQTDLAG